MSLEYKRWGYEDQRYLIGALQFIGGLGLLTGLYIRVFIPLSAGSLKLKNTGNLNSQQAPFPSILEIAEFETNQILPLSYVLWN